MTSLNGLGELVQIHDPWQWLFVVAAFALLPLRLRAARRSALAPWAATGVHVTLWALAVAFVGFLWDVAWHADSGRDKELFTVPHMLIVIGLFGIFAAGLLSIYRANRQGEAAGWAIGRWRVPYSSLPLTLLGGGALVGFPLDDFWHTIYGIDVTMWSPTHLLMIGGASLSPLAIWLMTVEGARPRPAGSPGAARARGEFYGISVAVLLGLSTFQLEYDMGIPQWQLLFQPALIAAAAGIGLVAARAALGRGGAISTALGFILLRGLLALFIGPALGHVLPRFPLYLAEALLVEAAFAVAARRRPLELGLLCGALIGTAGLAAEWGWTHLWYPHPWTANLLNDIWIAVATAIAASVVGIAVGRVLRREPAGVPAAAVAVSLAVIGGLIAWHLPAREAAGASAALSSRTVGAVTFATDASGQVSLRRQVALDVSITPSAAAAHPDWLTVVAWQGHAPVRVIQLVETAPGRYRAADPIPVGGSWKSLIFLARGDVVSAVPVAMPPDPEYHLAGIEPPVSRTERFVPASTWLMREVHGGAAWPAFLIVVAFAAAVVVWTLALCVSYWRFSVNPSGEALRLQGAAARRPRIAAT